MYNPIVMHFKLLISISYPPNSTRSEIPQTASKNWEDAPHFNIVNICSTYPLGWLQ